jgi:hypothetical protein
MGFLEFRVDGVIPLKIHTKTSGARNAPRRLWDL